MNPNENPKIIRGVLVGAALGPNVGPPPNDPPPSNADVASDEPPEDGREIARQCLRAAAQYKEMSSDEIQGLRVSSAEFVNGVVKPLAGSVGNLEERDEVKAGQIGRLLVRMQDLEKRLPPRPTRHPWPSWIIRLIAVVIAAVLVALTWDLIWEHIEIQHLRAEVADHRRVILDFIQYFKEHGAP